MATIFPFWIEELRMKIPGAVWGALMVALPLLAVWLEQNFGAYGWTPAVAGLLLIAVKVIEVVRSETPQPPPGVLASEHGGPSKTRKILLG
jgi:hypothetical protein